MNRSNLKAYVTAIQNAALSRKAALQCELAVGFAVMLEVGPSKRLARAQLCEIYATAGYKCSEPTDIDWKSINRRISGSLALWDFIGEEDVAKWAADHTKINLINAIVEKLAPLKLGTINEVLLICNKVKPQQTRGRKPGIAIDTQHIHFSVPQSATAEELLQIAAKLMAMAQEKTAAIAEQRQEELAEA